MRLFPWLAIALFATAAFLESGFFGSSTSTAWLSLVAAGTLCSVLQSGGSAWSVRGIAVLALALVPAAFVFDGLPRIAVLLALGGCALQVASPSWAKQVGRGLVFAGAFALLCSLTVFVYGVLSARAPELPAFLNQAISFVAGLAGVDHALDGPRLVLFTMRTKHALALTWSWFADPGFVAFFVGGVVYLSVFAMRQRLASVLRFASVAVAWLFLRATTSAALFLHEALLTPYDAEFTNTARLWNPWVDAVYMLPLVLFAAWLALPRAGAALPRGDEAPSPEPTALPFPMRASVVAALAGFVLVVGFFWQPSGERKGGRVLIDEFHSQVTDWTRWRWAAKRFDTVGTQRPYDTEWYGEDAAYNYASLYEYTGLHYNVDRLLERISDAKLQTVDVLVLKVPTIEFEEEEVQAVLRFVERGGGLLVIGEHTAVFGSGVSVNQIARQFGFEFRYDCLFGMDEVFHQSYEPWLLSHPASQHMGPMEFAVSCSIDPGVTQGTAFLRGMGLKNLDADYHARNAYPQPVDAAQMIAGSFVQGFATEHGKGRVLAFTDSTILANFSFFEPGKSELFLGMVEWLNHEQGMKTAWLAWLGLGLMAMAFVLLLRAKGAFFAVFAFAVLGTTLGVVTVRAAHATSMPVPERKRPCVAVAFDRSLCTAIDLPARGFIGGTDAGYGLFERAIQRLTKPQRPGAPGLPWITRRVSSLDDVDPARHAFLTLVQPNEEPSSSELAKLQSYVEGGGTLVVLTTAPDAMISARDAEARKADPKAAKRDELRSTTNAVLAPFGMSVDESKALSGKVMAKGFPELELEHSVRVEGGEAWMRLGSEPDAPVVAARKTVGNGRVIVLGFASRFRDTSLGLTPDVIPDAALRAVYDFEFALWRALKP